MHEQPDREQQRLAVRVIRERIELIVDDKVNADLHEQFNRFISALNRARESQNALP